MHLLVAQKGSINEGEEAVDLGQSHGDILFLSAADTEIASLAAAMKSRPDPQSSYKLRLANLMQLSHPMSVDVYCENMVANARLVVVRVLGGERYWSYGLEQLAATARANKVQLIVLPGDDKPDPDLYRFCTVEPTQSAKAWAYLCEGGPQNATSLLDYLEFLLDGGEEPGDAVPLIKAGIWHPETGLCDLKTLQKHWKAEAPVVAITFYRALVQSACLEPIEAMSKALSNHGINVLPVFVSSLKDPVSAQTVRSLFADASPDLILNATGFATGAPGKQFEPGVLEETGAVILQIILAAGSHDAWLGSAQGLSARDLAMNIALPEVDGKVLARAIAYKDAGRYDEQVETNIVEHKSVADRIEFVAHLASNWLALRKANPDNRKIALVMANYPNRDGRLGNGVGLDTPAGTLNVLQEMAKAGYETGKLPASSDTLMRLIQEGPTNAAHDGRTIRETISINDYNEFFSGLTLEIQNQVVEKWGEADKDPFFMTEKNAFALPAMRFGNVAVAIQPARGYNIDPKETYHSPDLVPPHGYLAFYAWVRKIFGAHAVVHMGKHGNLEWLPGKALSPSAQCFPEAVLGPLPHLYPFIVNDPGEGSQAKRRTSAVIIDHLTPPLTRAESYGPLRDLEALVDEYYEASGNDPRRIKILGQQILDLVCDIGLDKDAGIAHDDTEDAQLEKLDAYLCELKEIQIRDGLHVLGISPAGRLRDDLAVALVRVPRGVESAMDQSLQRAIAHDLGMQFDPLDCDMAKAWTGARPEVLQSVSDESWRSYGDSVERIELYAAMLVSGAADIPEFMQNTASVMTYVHDVVLPTLDQCGCDETGNLLKGLAGEFVPPGPSGAPTRGRNDVLPTGRNFYSVDSRSVPTRTAWELGRKSAELLITRYRQDNGDWPQSFGLSAWGTSNMRTGGDDIAQAMALIGAKPVWDDLSRRVTGYEIITMAELGRPRVDVTLRISGFFRDAFPQQIELFDKAVRAIGALEESIRDNPIAFRMKNEHQQLRRSGVNEADAQRRSGFRIFGSKPGAYGAGLQALIDEKGWENQGDLADAYLEWGSYAYGEKEQGARDRKGFEGRLSAIQAVVHNQDNREHDLLDSDDYYQFEGGMSAAVEHLSGAKPSVYHNDHSRPEKPVIRALEEEIGRVVRARVVNPKWIEGVKRHGYKGAFEMAATLDYMFAFSATTGAVKTHHFDLVFDAYLADPQTRSFLEDKNPAALKEMAERFDEALERAMWTPRSNSAKLLIDEIVSGASVRSRRVDL